MKLIDAQRNKAWQLIVDALKSGDSTGALFTLKRLAANGDTSSYAAIGYFYEFDKNRSFNDALYWYRKSVVEADDEIAHAGLARLYFNGCGVAKDYVKAAYHCKKASADPLMWILLGVMYHKGFGTEQDLVKAEMYYKKAAQEGYLLPLQYLGQLEIEKGRYLRGIWLRIKGISINPLEFWSSKAAPETL